MLHTSITFWNNNLVNRGLCMKWRNMTWRVWHVENAVCFLFSSRGRIFAKVYYEKQFGDSLEFTFYEFLFFFQWNLQHYIKMSGKSIGGPIICRHPLWHASKDGIKVSVKSMGNNFNHSRPDPGRREKCTGWEVLKTLKCYERDLHHNFWETLQNACSQISVN